MGNTEYDLSPGKGQETFRIQLDRDWFSDGDLLESQAKIGKPTPIFRNWRHKFMYYFTFKMFYEPQGYIYKVFTPPKSNQLQLNEQYLKWKKDLKKRELSLESYKMSSLGGTKKLTTKSSTKKEL